MAIHWYQSSSCFFVVASCGSALCCWRFRGIYYLHHRGWSENCWEVDGLCIWLGDGLPVPIFIEIGSVVSEIKHADRHTTWRLCCSGLWRRVDSGLKMETVCFSETLVCIPKSPNSVTTQKNNLVIFIAETTANLTQIYDFPMMHSFCVLCKEHLKAMSCYL
jgi:hypothetical protein